MQALLDLGRPSPRLALRGDVGDGALEQHATIGQPSRTSALDHLELGTVVAPEPVGQLELLAGAHANRIEQRVVPLAVLRVHVAVVPDVGFDPRRRFADQHFGQARRDERAVRIVCEQFDRIQVQARRELGLIGGDTAFDEIWATFRTRTDPEDHPERDRYFERIRAGEQASRVYRLHELQRCSGTQLDPGVVAALHAVVAAVPGGR